MLQAITARAGTRFSSEKAGSQREVSYSRDNPTGGNTLKFAPSLKTLLLCFALTVPRVTDAQTAFNSGSTGAYGPLTVDNTTGDKVVALPPDGILNCTTITVTPGHSLSFTKNANNTPVYLLATGDVTLSGYVYVQGSGPTGRRGGDGGPGGFAGGQGGPSPSNGLGPGGGKGGWVGVGTTNSLPTGSSYRGSGGFGTSGIPTATAGPVYGNSLLIPLVGGSGGGGAFGGASDVGAQVGGGGGGGALLVASNTKITMGWDGYNGVLAQGGYSPYQYGFGSGGGVRFVAPTITGTGAIRVVGGGQNQQGTGGYGRVRLDALTNSLNLVDADGSAGYTTFGANMTVFLSNLPQIKIISAAGQTIATDRVDPVFVLLPAGTSATQAVIVQVSNFKAVVPLRAVITPESGDRLTFDFQVDNTVGGNSNGSVNVQIPAGVSTRIDVWTR